MAKCLPSFPKSPEAGRKLGSTGEELSLPMSVLRGGFISLAVMFPKTVWVSKNCKIVFFIKEE